MRRMSESVSSGKTPTKDKSKEVIEESCETEVSVVNYSYKWTIRNFSFCQRQTGRYFRSLEFPSRRIPSKHRWYIKLYPRGKDKTSENYLSVFLYLIVSENHPEMEVSTKFNFSVLNAKGEKTNSTGYDPMVVFASPGDEWGHKDFVLRDFVLNKANNLLVDDKLTICCDITAAVDVIDTPISISPVQVPTCELSEDLGQMLGNQKFTDVILNVEGCEIPAHKLILSARSPVFERMFEHDMKESQENRVDIKDIEVNVFHEMLNYIYTGRSENINKMATELLPAADRFGLVRLKALCESTLASQLGVENVADILALAKLYMAEQLLATAVQFVIAHLPEVMETTGWKLLIANPDHMCVVVEILHGHATPVEPFSEVLPE